MQNEIEHIGKKNVRSAWNMFSSLCKEQGTEKFLSADFSQFENQLCSPSSILKGILARCENTYAGLVLYYFGASPYQPAPFLVFTGMYVLPAFRKQGIATTLMNEIHKTATKAACASIRWNVVRDNIEAVSYYAHLGFSSHPDSFLEYIETPDAFLKGIELGRKKYLGSI